MIFDHLSQLHRYECCSSRLPAAFEFLRTKDLQTLEIGRHEIDGDRIFALVQEYQTKLAAQAMWEAHRKYIDVQFIVAGEERMGYAPLETMSSVSDYDEQSDAIKLAGNDRNGSELIVSAGMFAIFFPHDAHRPTMAANEPCVVRKIVIKVERD